MFLRQEDDSNHQQNRNKTFSSCVARWFLETPALLFLVHLCTFMIYPVFRPSSWTQKGLHVLWMVSTSTKIRNRHPMTPLASWRTIVTTGLLAKPTIHELCNSFNKCRMPLLFFNFSEPLPCGANPVLGYGGRSLYASGYEVACNMCFIVFHTIDCFIIFVWDSFSTGRSLKLLEASWNCPFCASGRPAMHHDFFGAYSFVNVS